MRLPGDELSQLIALHKTLKKRSDADKIKCIIYHGKGWSWEEIKEALFISDGTIKVWLDLYSSGGTEELLKNRHKGNHFNLTSEQEKQLTHYVETYNILSSSQVCQYVKRKFGIKYSNNGMTLLLKRLKFSYRKPKLRPPKVNYYKQLSFIWSYRFKMLCLSPLESLYFLDATGFVHNARLDYGWFKKGKSKEIKAKTGRQKINVNGAYNPKTGEVITVSQKTNMNTDSNIALIKKIIEKDKDKKEITLILDNAKMNHSKKLIEFIDEQKIKINLWYLPTYSPHLNLIERLWRFSKKKLLSNKYYSSFMKFISALENFFDHKIHRMKKELSSLMVPNFQRFY